MKNVTCMFIVFACFGVSSGIASDRWDMLAASDRCDVFTEEIWPDESFDFMGALIEPHMGGYNQKDLLCGAQKKLNEFYSASHQKSNDALLHGIFSTLDEVDYHDAHKIIDDLYKKNDFFKLHVDPRVEQRVKALENVMGMTVDTVLSEKAALPGVPLVLKKYIFERALDKFYYIFWNGGNKGDVRLNNVNYDYSFHVCQKAMNNATGIANKKVCLKQLQWLLNSDRFENLPQGYKVLLNSNIRNKIIRLRNL